MYDIKYRIEARDNQGNTNKIDFNFITDGYYVMDTYVLNPLTNQYCFSISQAIQGYSEMNEVENRLLKSIEDFTHYPEHDIIYEFDIEDIDKQYHYKEDGYEIIITCTDVSIY